MGETRDGAGSTVGLLAARGGAAGTGTDSLGVAAGPGGGSGVTVAAYVVALLAGAVGSLLVAVVWTWLVAPMVAPARVSPPRGVPSPVQTCYQDATDPDRFDCYIEWTA